MSIDHLLQLVQLLAVPGLGLLWRISNQLAALTALQNDHARRLTALEQRPGPSSWPHQPTNEPAT